jgi:hypothetical protein
MDGGTTEWSLCTSYYTHCIRVMVRVLGLGLELQLGLWFRVRVIGLVLGSVSKFAV